MRSVWYCTKPSDPRAYTWTTQPPDYAEKALLKDGYSIFRVDFELPWRDSAVPIAGKVVEA
jgi:hypothetical protein